MANNKKDKSKIIIRIVAAMLAALMVLGMAATAIAYLLAR